MQPLSTAAIISYILFAVAVLIKLYLLIKLFFKRREKRLVRTQPIYGALMMVGGIFLDATCLVLPGEPTIPRCLFSQAWVPLGFTIFYSPLAFKTFRVWQQLGSADVAEMADGETTEKSEARDAKKAAGFFKRRQQAPRAGGKGANKHNELKQMARVAALVVFHCVVIAICFAAAPAEERLEGQPRPYQINGQNGIESINITEASCPRLPTVLIVELSLQAVLVVVTLYLAWKCRRVFTEFNESVPILFVSILIGFAAIIVIPLVALEVMAAQGWLEYLITYIIIVTITSIVPLIVLGDKLLPCFENSKTLISYEAWVNKLRGQNSGSRDNMAQPSASASSAGSGSSAMRRESSISNQASFSYRGSEMSRRRTSTMSRLSRMSSRYQAANLSSLSLSSFRRGSSGPNVSERVELEIEGADPPPPATTVSDLSKC